MEQNLRPLDIVNQQALDNAFVLDMAMGGSTNTVLHVLALAHSAGMGYDLNRINRDFRNRRRTSARSRPAVRKFTWRTCIAWAASAPS